MNSFGKLKLELHLIQQHFSPPTTPLKQGKSKTTLGPDTFQAHPSYAEQFLSVNFFKSCGSNVRSHDLLGPAITNEFHVPGLSPIRT